jgi:NAD(P)-dependent dehydrogenase (short-subunit alcohol dehydrogenase family)
MRFTGKVAVVTGAASGIGRETALLFAREGAQVFAADIDLAAAEALAAEVAGITAVACDVCDVAQIEALMDRTAAESGGIDILFNNAGAGGDPAPIDAIEADGWDRTMDLLLRSVPMEAVKMLVLMKPGCTALTRMPYCARSAAATLVSCNTPALATA